MLASTDSDLLTEVEQFLYREARLLDERQFEAWLDLFTEDVVYWMPILSNRLAGDLEREVSKPNELSYFNDDLPMLRARIARLDSGMAWAEDPPSRTVRIVTNVEVTATDDPSELDVSSAFQLYRNRLETEADMFVGRRFDRLRRKGDGFRIARRKILLAQNVLLAKNLSVFF